MIAPMLVKHLKIWPNNHCQQTKSFHTGPVMSNVFFTCHESPIHQRYSMVLFPPVSDPSLASGCTSTNSCGCWKGQGKKLIINTRWWALLNQCKFYPKSSQEILQCLPVGGEIWCFYCDLVHVFQSHAHCWIACNIMLHWTILFIIWMIQN